MKAVTVDAVCVRKRSLLYRCQARTFPTASQLSLLVREIREAGEARSYASRDLADSGFGANIISYSYDLEEAGTRRSLSATESTSGSTKALHRRVRIKHVVADGWTHLEIHPTLSSFGLMAAHQPVSS